MIKVVITDGSFGSFDVEKGILEPLGCEVVARQGVASPGELAPLVADADYVLTQFVLVNAEVIAAMRRAKVIVRYGVGVDNVDLDAARSRGIPVCNVPDYCLNEVADHTLALILATTRHVVAHCVGVRNGRWAMAVPLTAMKALCDLTVGVMGFGRIGREVVRRLQAFRCRVLVHDPAVPAGQIRDSGCVPASPEELLSQSDLVTLHLPATAQTRHMINRETIARMKPGAILVNVSRGSLVDSAALVEALERRHLSAAGLDVFDPEPIPADSPLLRMENVVVSPHNASASEKAARMLREKAAGIVSKAIRGEPLPNVVNGVLAR
ncbi:MAG: C-terminal binding protein [Deltaproteobacteria bacterium]